MRRRIGYGLYALAAFAVALLLQAPARLVVSSLEPDLAPVRLAGVTGTLRLGQARELSVDGIPVAQAAWQAEPLGMLGARAQYAVTLEGPQGLRAAGHLAARVDGALEARGWVANAPLEALRGNAPDLPPELKGLLHLELQRLVARDGRLEAIEGRLQLRELRWVDAEPLQLGDFTMELSTDGQGDLVGTLGSEGAVVGVSGTVRLEAGGGYRVQVQLRDVNRAPDAVRGIIRTLAPVRPDGSAAFQWTGRWR